MKKFTLHFVCLLVLLMAGCKSTILEFPDGEGVDPTLVNVDLNLEVDPDIEPYAPSKSEEDAILYDVRWMVEIFKDEISDTPVLSKVLSSVPDPGGNHKISFPISLHAADYHIVAWAEYVDAGSLDDKYYIVESLSSISIPEVGGYIGNEDAKDTYVAVQEMDLRSYRDLWDVAVSHDVILTRPMAKIEFITTDLEKFLYELESQHSKGEPVADNLLSDNPDFSSISIEVQYAGYFPTGFNARANKPTDARTGMAFTCKMTRLSAGEARLASDFVFVNGSESSVQVNLLIRDRDGNLLNEVGGVKVPVVRGRLTTIKDEFLTKNYAPGIGIDPGFDGEINITIPD